MKRLFPLVLLAALAACNKESPPVEVPIDPTPTAPPVSSGWSVKKICDLPKLAEKSGACFSHDRLYVIQDSDNPSDVSVFDLSCKPLGKIKLKAQNNDFEAIACDGENLYVGDIGDGASPAGIWSFPEPKTLPASVEPVFTRLKYADGKDKNAEGLTWDPKLKRLVLATKDWDGQQKLHHVSSGIATPIKDLPVLQALGEASIHPSGEWVLITQDESKAFWKCAWDAPCEQLQGAFPSGDHESTAWINPTSFVFMSEDEDGLYMASEAPVVVPTPTAPPGTGSWWKPGPIKKFQIMHISSLSDLKSKLKPGTEVVTLELDQAEKVKGAVEHLHAQGIKAVCYFSIGFEDWRGDSAQYPKDAMGNSMADWAGEKWGDISKPSLHAFLGKRMDRCKALGMDGVEPDNQDGFGNKKESGLNITLQQNVDGIKALASMAHAKGMAIFQKNATDMAQALAPFMDGIYIESCEDYNECGSYLPYKGKLAAISQYKKACKVYDWAVCRKVGDYFE